MSVTEFRIIIGNSKEIPLLTSYNLIPAQKWSIRQRTFVMSFIHHVGSQIVSLLKRRITMSPPWRHDFTASRFITLGFSFLHKKRDWYVVMTTYGATNDDKVDNMIILVYLCL